jgi:uncharacterized protein (TIGR03086 family)
MLERAVLYGLSSLEPIQPRSLSDPTPCEAWDLAELLQHVSESVTILQQGAELGCLSLIPTVPPAEPNITDDPRERVNELVGSVTLGVRRLLDTWQRMRPTEVRVEGQPISAETVEIVGAIEIAVHGWDIFESTGRHRPIPVRLALELTRALPRIAGDLIRPGLFAPPVHTSPLGSPSDRLVAFLGRRPRRDEFLLPLGS